MKAEKHILRQTSLHTEYADIETQILGEDIWITQYESTDMKTDIVILHKSKLPDLIKILQSFVVMLLLSFSGFAQNYQSTLIETSTSGDHVAMSAMYGFTNFQEDSFHAGLLYKHYGSANRKGVRVNVNLNLNALMFVFIQSDIFAGHTKQDNSSFMENSAGLGFRLFKGLSASLGYQMEDYNPMTEIRSEDRALVKLGYKIRL
jgi:hypothetical protein